MRAWAITLGHIDLPLLTYSIGRFYETCGERPYQHILVDHHWPIEYWNHRRSLLRVAEQYDLKVMSPYKNLGAHGGLSWTLANIPELYADDVVLTYDGDSNPCEPVNPHTGWLTAMMRVMEDQSYAAVSLSLNVDNLNTTSWDNEMVNGIVIKRPANNGIEMMNVTMWRIKFIQSTHGFRANSAFYGFLEGPMFHAMREQGLKHGYLADHLEDLKPFEPDPRYQAWKNAHLCGYRGNFDQYLKEK